MHLKHINLKLSKKLYDGLKVIAHFYKPHDLKYNSWPKQCVYVG